LGHLFEDAGRAAFKALSAEQVEQGIHFGSGLHLA
jgi:hypothetical protein